jgi:hypothetical protein
LFDQTVLLAKVVRSAIIYLVAMVDLKERAERVRETGYVPVHRLSNQLHVPIRLQG